MEVALVSGASTGIGLSIVRKLVDLKFKVYGLARDFAKCEFENERYVPLQCDIRDSDQLVAAVDSMIAAEGRLDLLINNAGVGYFGPHETISPERLRQMVETNLLGPLLLTGATLRQLKERKGAIINIASTSAVSPHRFGCAYGATKAGLLQFSRSLWSEVRKSGVRVAVIVPDMTRTDFYETADFAPHDDPDCTIEPDCIAQAVDQVLAQRSGTVLTEIVIQPQRVQVARKTSAKARAGTPKTANDKNFS